MYVTFPDMLQAGQAALADGDLNAALYWFKFVSTWAPSAWQPEIRSCEAVGARPTLMVRGCKLQ